MPRKINFNCGNCRCVREDNIKIDVKETGLEDAEWINLAEDGNV
jgi:hypothetical protein